MTLGAGGPHATRHGESVFRATMSDGKMAAIAVADLLAGGAKKGCIMSADSSYYVDMVQEIKAAWKTGGGEIVFDEEIPYIPLELKSAVTKLRQFSCDAIFAWASPAGLSPLIRELRMQGVRGVRVLPWFAGSEDLLQATIGDSEQYFLYRYKISDSDFIERFQKRYNEAPMRPAGNCYDGVRVLAKVIGEVGTKREDIRRGLMALANYKGVTGPFIVPPDREREGEDIEKMEIVAGKLVPRD